MKRFLAATAQGYEYSIDSPELAAQDFVKQVPELDRKLVLASSKYLAGEYKKGLKKWGVQSEQSWDRYLKWAHDIGLVTKVEPASRYFDNRFLP